jgi:branched-chain amino acid transport system permease protein
VAFIVMALIFIGAPLVGVYPVFMMKVMCFALFACAFNLLLGYGGLLSFGHAMFLGSAGYVSAHAAKVWGLSPELAILPAPCAPARWAGSRASWRSAARASISP